MEQNKDENTQAQSSFGKFKTAEELLAAYNALQAEFTKRCQQLSELQTELQTVKNVQAQDTPQSPTEQTINQARDSQVTPPCEISHEAKSEISHEQILAEILANIDGYAAALCAIPQIMDACIASYKQRLLEQKYVPSPSGFAVISPARRPKTLYDAKILADRLLGE